MAQNPELHLWRTVLALALREDGAARWIRTDDAAMVCALAGLERGAVALALLAGLPKMPKINAGAGISRETIRAD